MSVRATVLLAALIVTSLLGQAPAFARGPDHKIVILRSLRIGGEDGPTIRRSVTVLKPDDSGCRAGDADDCEYLARRFENKAQLRLGHELYSPGAASALYFKACNLGRGRDCIRVIELGSMENGGSFGEKDAPPNSATLVTLAREQACNLGILEQCGLFARALIDGTGIGADPPRAAALAYQTCRRGDRGSCLTWASLLATGNGTKAEPAQARELLIQGCRRAEPGFCGALGNLALGTSLGAPDAEMAQSTLANGCAQGDAQSCVDTGRTILTNRITAPAARSAADFYDDACKINQDLCILASDVRNYPDRLKQCQDGTSEFACQSVGEMAEKPDSPFYDPAQAVLAYERICGPDGILWCVAAARLLASSKELESQIPAARRLRLYQYGCAFDGLSCKLAGDLSARGEGTERDPGAALALYGKACRLDYGDACISASQFQIDNPTLAPLAADVTFGTNEDVISDYQARHPYCGRFEVQIEDRTYSADDGRRCLGVVNGIAVPRGGAPWQALVERPEKVAGRTFAGGDRVLCGGSLIAKGWILTAAHCLSDHLDKNGAIDITTSGYKVRLGTNDISKPGGQRYRILQAIPHPNFLKQGPEQRRVAYDIALLRIDDLHPEVIGVPGEMRTIRLDPESIDERKIEQGDNVRVFGWGWTKPEDSAGSLKLNQAPLQLASLDACTDQTKLTDSQRRDSVLCAFGSNGQQACYGDSGGPLVSYDPVSVLGNGRMASDRKVPTLIAVVSKGVCGVGGVASRYTRVAKFADWIRKTIDAPGNR
ncbi:trypsin-like serine protease [Novosphingobium olei]|uniref:trypsin-like serine protease n=1 Tax=Novosphingobium olei TaxID=2728851 RepID=UPI003086F72F|nr:trypsin-like serine protease [Novosphingobium olei]